MVSIVAGWNFAILRIRIWQLCGIILAVLPRGGIESWRAIVYVSPARHSVRISGAPYCPFPVDICATSEHPHCTRCVFLHAAPASLGGRATSHLASRWILKRLRDRQSSTRIRSCTCSPSYTCLRYIGCFSVVLLLLIWLAVIMYPSPINFTRAIMFTIILTLIVMSIMSIGDLHYRPIGCYLVFMAPDQVLATIRESPITICATMI